MTCEECGNTRYVFHRKASCDGPRWRKCSTVGVVIGTFGSKDWASMGARLSKSVYGADKVVVSHADTLHEARNGGAVEAATDWLIFLDADDGLNIDYIEEMKKGSGDIRQPSTLGMYADGTIDDHPVLIPERNIYTSNYIVIGAMCRSSLFFAVGGFRDLPVLEDWDLWIRMIRAGAVVGKAPGAVYMVGVRPDGRNRAQDVHTRVYNQIIGEYK